MLQRHGETIKATLPKAAIASEPDFELLKRIGPQRVQTLLSKRAHHDEARIIQYSKVSRYSGLMDPRVLDDLTHRLLTALQRLDNAPPGAIGESPESVYMHSYVYI